jgi:hypothetical protein
MLHMRIVVPPDRRGEVMATLERTPSVINIVHLPDAARRPDGDLVLCDVPREAAPTPTGRRCGDRSSSSG